MGLSYSVVSFFLTGVWLDMDLRLHSVPKPRASRKDFLIKIEHKMHPTVHNFLDMVSIRHLRFYRLLAIWEEITPTHWDFLSGNIERFWILHDAEASELTTLETPASVLHMMSHNKFTVKSTSNWVSVTHSK